MYKQKDVSNKLKQLVNANLIRNEGSLDAEEVLVCGELLRYADSLVAPFQSRSIYEAGYRETVALSDLLNGVNIAVENDMRQLETENAALTEFAITIAGRSINFIIGGPQVQALFAFVESLADEQNYEVDYKTNTVIGD